MPHSLLPRRVEVSSHAHLSLDPDLLLRVALVAARGDGPRQA